MADELAFLGATAQAELARQGKIKPSELVAAAIARIEKLNPIQVRCLLTLVRIEQTR